MKSLSTLFSACLVISLFSSCRLMDNNPLPTSQNQFDSFCESANGSMELSVEGSNWNSSCLYGFLINFEAPGSTENDGLLYLYGFTGEGNFFQNGDYEGFWIIASIKDGQLAPDSEPTLLYWDGFAYALGVTNPQDFAEHTYFSSSFSSTVPGLNLQFSDNKFSGSFSASLANEDESQDLSVSGSFEFEPSDD